jgi:hypothetical protein
MTTKQFFFATICIFFLGNFTQANAQKTNTWIGGTPGQTTNWNCPKNWSTYQVPDAFQTVIIPDVESNSGFYPIINETDMEVNALVLESGASLTITKKGSLKVETTLEQFGDAKTELDGKLYVPSNVFAGEMKLEFGADCAIVAPK